MGHSYVHSVLYLFVYIGLYITFYLLGMGSYALATMPYSGLLADMTHPSLRGDPNISNYLYSVHMYILCM